jgi:hypothetical protein
MPSPGSAVRPFSLAAVGGADRSRVGAGSAAHCLSSAMAEESTISPRVSAPADPLDLVPSVMWRPR